MQYLLWQAPSSTAYPTRLSFPLQIVLGAYAALFYLPMSMLTNYYWRLVDHLMMLISLGVIALMIAAMPWGRRVWQRSQPWLPLPQRSSDPRDRLAREPRSLGIPRTRPGCDAR